MHTVVSLNPTETAFVRAIAEGHAPTNAAISAGRSIGMASHMLQRPAVNAMVRHLARHLGRVVTKMDAGPKPRRPRS